MLIYDGLACTFRNVKLRSRDPNCMVCGSHSNLTRLPDYEKFCGMGVTDKVDESSLVTMDPPTLSLFFFDGL